MPTVGKPAPITISSHEEGNLVIWEIKPGLGQKGDPVTLWSVSKFFLDQHPWLYAQHQLLAYRLGQDILERMGYKADVKQVGGTVAPSNESTIITGDFDVKTPKSH